MKNIKIAAAVLTLTLALCGCSIISDTFPPKPIEGPRDPAQSAPLDENRPPKAPDKPDGAPGSTPENSTEESYTVVTDYKYGVARLILDGAWQEKGYGREIGY